MAIEINGEEYEELGAVNNEVAQELGAKTLDEENLKERQQRTADQLRIKRAARTQKEIDRELYAYIVKHFGNTLKNVLSFFNLCKAKGLTVQDSADILKLYKALPKQAKKNVVERFLRI